MIIGNQDSNRHGRILAGSVPTVLGQKLEIYRPAKSAAAIGEWKVAGALVAKQGNPETLLSAIRAAVSPPKDGGKNPGQDGCKASGDR